jgi:hypothetical protein
MKVAQVPPAFILALAGRLELTERFNETCRRIKAGGGNAALRSFELIFSRSPRESF